MNDIVIFEGEGQQVEVRLGSETLWHQSDAVDGSVWPGQVGDLPAPQKSYRSQALLGSVCPGSSASRLRSRW
jgi:hypothetical protein